MAHPQKSALGSARTLEIGLRARAERSLAAALERATRSQTRVERARVALEGAQSSEPSSLPSTPTTGLGLRRHAAHRQARSERISSLKDALQRAQDAHAEQLAAVEQARSELALRWGKQQVIERELSAEQARERRTRERREQDEQDEQAAHRPEKRG
jgi:hypothetical protein